MKELHIFLARARLGRLSYEGASATELGDVIDLVENLLKELHLQLKDADQSNQMDELISKIEEAVCYTEDAFDSHGLRDKLRKKYSAKRSYLRVSSFLRKLHDPHARIKSDIKELTEQIRYGFRSKSISNSGPSVRVNERERHEWQKLNLLAHKPDRSPAVGLNQVKAQVIQDLLEKQDMTLKVVSLCGLGGVGKTTVAKQVFNDQRIKDEFVTKIWIRVSSRFKTKNLLLHMLSQFTSQEIDSISSEAQLAARVKNCLRESERYLVVLDDVWSTNYLDELHHFPDNKKGSRILLTTRKRQVAEYGNPEPIIYTVSPLREADARELFIKTIQRQRGSAYELEAYKEKIGTEMVQHCGGLPVAIIALGQVLAARKSSDEWDIVYQNTISFLNERVLEVLAPSFDDLPDHLKLCFLYLGIWPEDSVIDAEKLYHFWMVEGLLQLQDNRVGETPLDVAERYLIELARMSIIDVEEEESPIVRRRLKSCRIHKMMRQLCISKGNQMDFSHTIGSNSMSSSSRDKLRRLFVYLERPEDLSCILGNKELSTEHLRILQIRDSYKHRNREPVRLSGNKFEDKELRLLRLLDFDGVDVKQNDLPPKGSGLLEGVANLIHLRCLSFKGCFLDTLPVLAISNLLYLQILDLRVDDSLTVVTLPNVLWKLRKLKHLYLPRMFRSSDGEKLRLDGLVELETLDNFITRACNVTDLYTLTKLVNLAARIDGSLQDLKCISKHMKQSTHIQLSVDVRNFDCYMEDRHYVVRELLESRTVLMFCIEGHIGELPPKYKISPSLIKIVLSGSELEKDPMETLSQLPELRVLVLDDDAFVGKTMVSPASGFRELKHLELLSLQHLEKWVVETNSMPKLCNIKIENCKNLANVPDGFELLTALKELEISEMPKPFEDGLLKKAERQGEHMARIKNVNIRFHHKMTW